MQLLTTTYSCGSMLQGCTLHTLPANKEDRGAWWSGETAYPHGSPYSVVPVDRGAAFLLLPTAAQLCPLQLLLQLSDLAVRDGGEREVRQRQSILVPSPS